MNKNIRLIIIIVAVIALFIGAYFAYNSLKEDYIPDTLAPVVDKNNIDESNKTNESVDNNKADNSEEVDYSAPDFEVEDKNGNTVKLSDYFGKPIVLNMWASWCGPCQSEMPFFEEACKENDDIEFLMVNMTAGDSKESADDFIKENGYTFPVFYDVTGEASYTYGASSLPMTFFIDKNGDMITYAVGAINSEQLKQGMDMIR